MDEFEKENLNPEETADTEPQEKQDFRAEPENNNVQSEEYSQPQTEYSNENFTDNSTESGNAQNFSNNSSSYGQQNGNNNSDREHSVPYDRPIADEEYRRNITYNIDPSKANPIHYTEIENPAGNEKSRKGLRVFCLVIAALFLVSAGCFAGYTVGHNKKPQSHLYKDVELDLAAKPENTDEKTAAEVYEEVSPSVVGIYVYNKQGKASQATGIIYTKDGYVITNDHIYAKIGAPEFKVYTSDGKEYDAEYVAGDVISDLAILKIKDGKDLKPAVLGNSDEVYCGQNVAAIGKPFEAASPSVITKGIISLTSRRVQATSNYSARLIQTDSAINPGSSGGALVNMYGQVVGITSAKMLGGTYDRIGFAIPTTTVKRVVDQLISKGKVTDRAKLGISYTLIDSVTAEVKGIKSKGLYVADVTEDSDLYGKIKKGDIITHINSEEITDDDIVLDIIERCKAGDKITVRVLTENGSEKEFEAKLKANTGTSSYSEKILDGESGSDKNDDGEDGKNGDEFDFPFGE